MAPNKTTQWMIDSSHTNVNFSIKHMMIAKVQGGFEKVSGTLELDEAAPARSTIDVSIETASISTREPKRDEHLKSADFFNAEKYPRITFKSKKIEAQGSDHYIVNGELSIHGVSQPVALSVEVAGSAIKDPFGNIRMGASATTKIKRKDFGLTWNAALEAGGVLVGDDVSISLDVEFVKKA